MKKAASRETLNELHSKLSRHYIKKLEEDPESLTAADIGNILKLLNQSGIKADESGINQHWDDDLRKKLMQHANKTSQEDQDAGDSVLDG